MPPGILLGYFGEDEGCLQCNAQCFFARVRLIKMFEA